MASAPQELSLLSPVNSTNLTVYPPTAAMPSAFPSRTTLTTTAGNSRSPSPRNRHIAVVDSSIPSKVPFVPLPVTPQLSHPKPDDVFKVAFPLQDKEISKLLDCDYDSMASYPLLTSDEEAEKVRAEINRLISVVQKSDNVLFFKPRNNESLAAIKASKNGYVALADVVANVDRALRICNVDNDGISLLNAKIDITPKKFKSALARLNPDFYMKKKPQITKPSSDAVEGTATPPSYESCCDLVDYLTASLARVMTQMANGDSWHNSLLAVLAKLAAKMKVLLDDLESNCVTSLDNGEFALESYLRTFGDHDSNNETQVPDPVSMFRESSKSGNQDTFFMHCVEQQRIRYGPVRLLGYLLQALASTNNEAGMPTTTYEMLSVVIDTGYEGFKAHLCQDRDYEFSSTSNQDDLNFSHPAFNILIEYLEYIYTFKGGVASHQPLPSSSQGPTSLTTKIEWDYATDGSIGNDVYKTSQKPRPKQLELNTMGEISSVMIPLLLTTPYIAHHTKSFFDMFYLTADVAEEVRPYPETPYNAFIRLYTSEFKAPSAEGVLRLADAISQDLFSRDFLLKPHASRGGIMPMIKELLPQKRTDSSLEILRLMDEMSTWVYVETAVIVQCRLYVFMSMALAAVLVGGGLTIGLTLENRLKGVDPFNITVYAWALAAFLALVSKSIKVRDWTWSDFLHGRVLCRSVSELCSMTGYSDQLILAKLLHDERESILITRGPYNSVFERRAENNGDGFSIDVPVKTRTLLLSGLTMLKVQTPLGHGLVCLDARRGGHYSVVCHRGVGDKDTDELICQDIDRLTSSNSKRRTGSGAVAIKLPMRWSKNMEWRRVEGVYSELDAAFV